MDRRRRCTTGVIHQLIWRSTVGFRGQSFRFEGGGRLLIGLRRTGKSCRLRWVNYLHPDLKTGKMSPQEQRLVLELHSKWGNRWSRIARKLPGRTDNEIKNYWRTHMRKIAQEKRKAISKPSSKSSSCSSNSSSTNKSSQGFEGFGAETLPLSETKEYALGGDGDAAPMPRGVLKKSTHEQQQEDWRNKACPMDDIWNDFDLSTSFTTPIPFYDDDNGFGREACFSGGEIMGSPLWDDWLWSGSCR